MKYAELDPHLDDIVYYLKTKLAQATENKVNFNKINFLVSNFIVN